MLPTANLLQSGIGCGPKTATIWLEPMRNACRTFEINTARRLAAFLAQVGHESAGLSRTVEALGYSATRIREVAAGAPAGSRWRSLGPRAEQLAHNPQGLANAAYGGRMGNGPEGAGDGWRYRGRGPIQITGRANYEAITEVIVSRLRFAPDLVRNPEQLELPEWGGYSAAAYWHSRGLNPLADAGDFDAITRRINGGTSGAADRRARYERAKRAIA